MKRLSLLSIALVASVGWTQTKSPEALVPRNTLDFVEKPGVMEFTGRLIARPLQKDALMRLGVSAGAAEFNHVLAESALADTTIGHIKEIDCYIVKVPAGHTENTFAKQLMKTGLFEYVEPDYRVYPAFVPNDPQLVNQWAHTDNQSTNAWDICRGSSAVTISITDTGVHVTHEDLVTPRLPGANSATATDVSNVKTEAVDGISWIKDLHGHGTHTSGIAAASGNNGLGVCGVNLSGTKEFMVRVSDNAGGGSSLTALTIAALWSAQHGARIISTSYSGVQNSVIGTTGTTIKNNHNSLWFYAAGNDGGNYGAAFDWPDVVIVGSIDQGDGRSGFSAFGVFTDVFAPGGDILNTFWTNDSVNNLYASLSGTSMATPFAAGLGAMVLSQNPSYSAQRVEDIVTRSSITMNNANNFGWGRVNLWNAMGRVPNSVQLNLGQVVSGGVTDLYRVDGSSYVVQKAFVPTVGSAKVQIVTEHNVPAYAANNYGEIDIMATVSVNTTMSSFTQQYQLFNFTTGQYETVGSGVVTGSVFEADKTVTAANFANYIQGGKVKVRSQLFQTGFVPVGNYQASYDQITVRTLRATQ